MAHFEDSLIYRKVLVHILVLQLIAIPPVNWEGLLYTPINRKYLYNIFIQLCTLRGYRLSYRLGVIHT